jgi:hypothetical protein
MRSGLSNAAAVRHSTKPARGMCTHSLEGIYSFIEIASSMGLVPRGSCRYVRI